MLEAYVTSDTATSMAIRDPAPNSQSRSTITVDKSFFQQHDISHVQAKYPACADYLTERLGRAISGRRQYLTYREEHHQKLAKNVEKIGFEDSRTGKSRRILQLISNSDQTTRATAPKQRLCPSWTVKTASTYSTKMTALRKPPSQHR